MMMSDHRAMDDLLARAEEALRRTTVPDGRPEEAFGRILTRLNAESGPCPPVPSWRRRLGQLPVRWTAAVATAMLGYLAATWVGPPARAFAEVAQQLRDAQTLAYRTTAHIAGQALPVEVRVMVNGPGLVRCETEPLGTVTVLDMVRNRILVLDRKSRSAYLIERPASDGVASFDVAARQVEQLRELGRTRGQFMGRRRIGNIEAEGYRVRQPGQDTVVWVDPRGRLPLRIELNAGAADAADAVSLFDIQINPRLDGSLFRLEPPEGYALSTERRPAASGEEAVANVLRIYAEHAGGRFPPRLDDWVGYAKVLPEDKFDGATNPRVVALLQDAARVEALKLECEGDHGYRPAGVKLGDARKIVFWFRRKGAAHYRAIHGDLHTADVSADQLPDQQRDRASAD
jgi:outer membrane lipoprotein-sorting protein